MLPNFNLAHTTGVYPSLSVAAGSPIPVVAIKPEPSQQRNGAPVLRSGSTHAAARTEWETPAAAPEFHEYMSTQPFGPNSYVFGMYAPALNFSQGYSPLPLAESATVHIPPDTQANFTLYEELLRAVKLGPVEAVASVLKQHECQQVLMQMQPGGPMSPLMIASRDNNIEMVLTLTNTGYVDARAVDNQVLLTDSNGKTALQYAEEKGHTRVVTLLQSMVGYGLQREQIASRSSELSDTHPYMTLTQQGDFSNLYAYVTTPIAERNPAPRSVLPQKM